MGARLRTCNSCSNPCEGQTLTSCLPDAFCRDFDNDDIDADEPDLDNEGEEGEEGDKEGEEGADQGVVEVGDAPEDGVAGHAVDKDDRITTPYMTKYERARILGTRAVQIRCLRIWEPRTAHILACPAWRAEDTTS